MQGLAGTAEWYISAATLEEEEDMLASDDEFETDRHDNRSVDEDESGSDGEDVVDDDDAQIPSEEVDELMEDAYGEEAQQRRMDHLSQKDTAKYEPVDHPLSEPVDRLKPRWASLERKTREVYDIYKRNGWPSNFARESCRMMLTEFLEREEGLVNHS